MYEKAIGKSEAEQEHILLAKQMANELMSRFGELPQNEALSVIRQMFVERRQENIKEVEDRMKHLQDSLARLQ
jgi:urease gamma subunit